MDNVSHFIQGCLAGDRSCWEQVRSIAQQFLSRYKKSQAEDHGDIIQEVFIKLMLGFRSFKGTTASELRQYIKVATMREAVSYHRKSVRHQSHDSLDQSLDNDDTGNTLYDLLPDGRLDPAAVSAINDLIQKAAAQLSVRDMQLVMFKAEGYKDREIAEMLGFETVGGVAVTYNRIKGIMGRTLLMVLLIILFGRKLPWVTSL